MATNNRGYDWHARLFMDDRSLYLAEKTIGWYEKHLLPFGRFVQDKWPITKDDVLAYISDCRQRNNQPSTINIYLKGLKTLCRWCKMNKYLRTNPFDQMTFHFLREKPTVPPILTQEEIRAVLEYARKIPGSGIRNYAIIMLMLDTAIRPGEMLDLKLSNVNFENDTIKVCGKMGERIVGFSSMTKRALQSYLRIRCTSPNEDVFFVQVDGRPMNKNGLHQLFFRIKQQTGIRRFYGYLFRHTSATSYLRNGANLDAVRRILGHRFFAVTQRYTHLSDHDLVEIQQKTSPVMNLRMAKRG
jgi:integrase/recombinase XerD